MSIYKRKRNEVLEFNLEQKRCIWLRKLGLVGVILKMTFHNHSHTFQFTGRQALIDHQQPLPFEPEKLTEGKKAFDHP